MSDFYIRLLLALLAYYSVAAVLTALVYGFDKLAAMRGWRRVRERSLHLLGLLGGWPGAYVAQRMFRHKTRKQPFRSVFWTTVVFNLSALAWLLSPYGVGWVHDMAAMAGWP